MFLYTLYGDPSWRGITRPVYTLGRCVGTIGVAHPSARFPFPSHDAAIRHTIDPQRNPIPMSFTGPSPLNAAVIMDLRVSVRSRISDAPAEGALAPCVRFNAALDGYELHRGGAVLCWTRDLGVLAALLRGERFEPGFIGKCLDPSYLATELALDADAREAQRRHRFQIDADARARLDADADAKRRRSAVLRETDAPDDLSIDDLFSTL